MTQVRGVEAGSESFQNHPKPDPPSSLLWARLDQSAGVGDVVSRWPQAGLYILHSQALPGQHPQLQHPLSFSPYLTSLDTHNHPAEKAELHSRSHFTDKEIEAQERSGDLLKSHNQAVVRSGLTPKPLDLRPGSH